MSDHDLTPSIQELMVQMAQMRAELTELKTQATLLTLPTQPAQSRVTTTRRNTIKKLGLALLGGTAAATALVATQETQARTIVNPTGFSNKVGMVVVPPGGATPANKPTIGYYGLIACGDTAALDTTLLTDTNVGLTGIGSADGQTGIGVSGYGYYGLLGTGSRGVYGVGSDSGVYGYGSLNGVFGNSSNIGVLGFNFNGGAGTAAVKGEGRNIGVWGECTFGNGSGVGVYGSKGTGFYAGYFDAAVAVLGVLTKAGGSFKIDHPVDPANKYLYHSFVESPDMLNIYNGMATLGEKGEAVVEMPSWFEALNSDYRYQLTCLGSYAPVYISEEIKERKFKIAGGISGQKVSWQVTGIRQDAWAKANRIPVEENKTVAEKGKYLHPELFGKLAELRIGKP